MSFQPVGIGNVPDDDPSLSGPNDQLGFEIRPEDFRWRFTPEFYPENFVQMREKELDRNAHGCEGEDVSPENHKNREYNVRGKVLASEIDVIHKMQDHTDVVDIISPLVKNGGSECHIKKVKLGNEVGWDPMHQQRMFEYTIDLVSTGRDEHGGGNNGIVTAIIGPDPNPDS